MLVVALLSCSGLLPVHAAEVAGLYEVDLPVSTQEAKERGQVTRLGLERVIQRVSGSKKALLSPGVAAALKTPERYIQAFNYFTPGGANSGQGQHLRLQFDAVLIDRLLRQTKQPLWGNKRPSVISWVAVGNSGQRAVVSADDNSAWHGAILQAGQGVGLPVLLPLMDLQDSDSISAEDVWALLPHKLENASFRYRAEAVLGGRVFSEENQGWKGLWVLVFEGSPVRFSTRGGSKEQVLSEAMASVAERLSSRYAVDTTREFSSQLMLSVEGIESLTDYANLTDYLKGFAVVRDVTVSRVEDDRMTLVLTTESDWQVLKELIALDRKLEPLPAAASEFEDGVMVAPYAWRR